MLTTNRRTGMPADKPDGRRMDTHTFQGYVVGKMEGIDAKFVSLKETDDKQWTEIEDAKKMARKAGLWNKVASGFAGVALIIAGYLGVRK